MSIKRKIAYSFIYTIFFLLFLSIIFSKYILIFIGEFLVLNEPPVKSDAIVILNYDSIEFYQNLIKASSLYKEGLASKIVINGDNKIEKIKELEKLGFKSCSTWREDAFKIFELTNIPAKNIITINTEKAYDDITQAKIIGKFLKKSGIKNILLITSKSQTRISNFIWKKIYPDELQIVTIASDNTFYSKGWWKDGEQTKLVLKEYHKLIYYCFKKIFRIDDNENF